MFLIVALIILAVMLVIVLANAIKGLIKGVKKSIASLIAIVVSAAIAAAVTAILCMPSFPIVGAATDFMVSTLETVLPAGAYSVLTETLLVTFSYYVSMLIAPFVFTLLFVIISIIVSIIASIVIKKIRIMKNVSKSANRLGGLGIGLLCGLLVAVLCIFPFVGVADIAEESIGVIYDEVATMDGVQAALDSLPVEIEVNTRYMKMFDYCGCGLLYDLSSSAIYEGEIVNLGDDVRTLVDMGKGLLSIDTESGELNDSHVEAVRGCVSAIDRSPLLRNMIAEVVAFATQEENGIISLDLGEFITPLVDEMLGVLSTSTKDTVVADLTTIVNVLDIVVESEIVGTSDYQAILDKLGKDQVATVLLLEINQNPRMYPVADEITVLGIRAMALALGIPADADERYDMLMDDIAAVLNETEGENIDCRIDNVCPKLYTLFEDYGITIEGEPLIHLADGLVSDLGNNVSGSEVKEFFIIYHYTDASGEGYAKAVSVSASASDENNSGILINSDGTISVGDMVFTHYNADNYTQSKAYAMGSSHTDLGVAADFYDANKLRTNIVTVDDIVSNMEHYVDCKDAKLESEKVGAVFTAMSQVVSDQDLDNLDTATVFGDLGHVFDLMKDSEIFSTESTKDLLSAMLQSEKIGNSLKLSKKDMTAFANNINDYASDRSKGYEEATIAISGTLEAVNKASDKEASHEEKVEATKNMIDVVNKDNSSMISSMVSADMIGDYGVGVDNSDSVSDALKNMVHNMADFKEGNPNDEELGKEAEAVSKMLSLAMVGSGDGPMFDTEDGEKGSVASDSESFIAQVVESDVVMTTITQSVDGKEQGSNPYGISYKNEQEKESVSNAIEKYYVENGGGEELATKLGNLAIVMDIEVSFQ